jgi:hypothetical protein
MLASTWLTRCGIGALDPTHGQLAEAAVAARTAKFAGAAGVAGFAGAAGVAGFAGVAGAAEAGPAARASDAAAAAAPRTATRDSFRRDDMPNEPMMPPDTCFTGIAEGVRDGQ